VGAELGWTTTAHCLVGENEKNRKKWEKMGFIQSYFCINIKEKHQRHEMEIQQNREVFIQKAKISESSEKHWNPRMKLWPHS